MSEILIILKAIGVVTSAMIASAILIHLCFYLHKNRMTSKKYRQIEFTIIFVLLSIWGHSWSNDLEYLQAFWIIVLYGFILTSFIIWNLPIMSKKQYAKTHKEVKG